MMCVKELPRQQNLEDTITRVLRTAAGLHWPENLVEKFRDDAQAECRWWNSLRCDERTAYVRGAKLPSDCSNNDWLDIGETNRHRILSAAHAVQCWLAGSGS